MTGIRLIQDDEGVVDLELSGGQMAVGDVTEQNQSLLLLTRRGEWKENPRIGVGIDDILNDHDLEQWKRLIADALEQDGQIIETLDVSQDKLTLNARYRK